MHHVTSSDGVTLLEVLIALLIFSTGILATANMQIRALQWAKKSEAICLANNDYVTHAELNYSVKPNLQRSTHFSSRIPPPGIRKRGECEICNF